MRKLRILICALSLASVMVFGLYYYKVERTKDTEPPVITCEDEEIEISVKDGEDVLLEGITATDRQDGDLTDSIRVVSMSHFINGKRNVEYVVFDEANQVATYERSICYSDYTTPKIHLKKPLRYVFSGDQGLDLDGYYEAKDCLDGDLTNEVRAIMDIYYGTTKGNYSLTLQVSNSAGDVCSLPVELYISYAGDEEEERKVYPVLSQYSVYTKVGKKISPSKYLTGIAINGVEYEFGEASLAASAKDVTIQSNVDYKTPGVYTVAYTYKSSEGVKATTELYVVVEEE